MDVYTISTAVDNVRKNGPSLPRPDACRAALRAAPPRGAFRLGRPGQSLNPSSRCCCASRHLLAAAASRAARVSARSSLRVRPCAVRSSRLACSSSSVRRLNRGLHVDDVVFVGVQLGLGGHPGLLSFLVVGFYLAQTILKFRALAACYSSCSGCLPWPARGRLPSWRVQGLRAGRVWLPKPVLGWLCFGIEEYGGRVDRFHRQHRSRRAEGRAGESSAAQQLGRARIDRAQRRGSRRAAGQRLFVMTERPVPEQHRSSRCRPDAAPIACRRGVRRLQAVRLAELVGRAQLVAELRELPRPGPARS